MRTLVAVAMAAVICVGLAGCGSERSSAGPSIAAVKASTTEVSFVVDGTRTYGTLEVPAHRADQHLAAALLLAGSGSTDRNGNQGSGLTPNTLGQIATALDKMGIMSLRFDKYFAGRTGGGSYASDPGSIDLNAFIRQADDAYKLLLSQPSADRNRMLVVGHSEGGMYAILVAETVSPHPVGLALVEPQDERLLDLVALQIDESLNAAASRGAITTGAAQANAHGVQQAISDFRAGQPVDTSGLLPSVVTALTPVILSSANASYVRTDDAVDVPTYAAKLPSGTWVLVTDGTADTNVPPSTIQPLVDSLASAGTTGPGLQTLDGLDHDLNPAGTQPNGAALDPAFVSALRHWALPYASRWHEGHPVEALRGLLSRHEARGAVVVAEFEAYTWLDDSDIGMCGCITLVRGADLGTVAWAFGGDLGSAVETDLGSLADLEDDRYLSFAALIPLDDWTLVVEALGQEGTRSDVLRRLTAQAEAASWGWDANGPARFAYARDGVVVMAMDDDSDWPPDGTDPHRFIADLRYLGWDEASWEEGDWDGDHRWAALATRVTGVQVRPEMVAGRLTAVGLRPWPWAVPIGREIVGLTMTDDLIDEARTADAGTLRQLARTALRHAAAATALEEDPVIAAVLAGHANGAVADALEELTRELHVQACKSATATHVDQWPRFRTAEAARACLCADPVGAAAHAINSAYMATSNSPERAVAMRAAVQEILAA